MTTQLDLFEEVEVKPPEPRTRVQMGTRMAQVPLRKRRREALQRLMEVLEQLEGKDVYISTYGGAHSHFWLHNLKLGRLRVERFQGGDKIPSVVVLWGSRGASVRMFTDQVISESRNMEAIPCGWWTSGTVFTSTPLTPTDQGAMSACI